MGAGQGKSRRVSGSHAGLRAQAASGAAAKPRGFNPLALPKGRFAIIEALDALVCRNGANEGWDAEEIVSWMGPKASVDLVKQDLYGMQNEGIVVGAIVVGESEPRWRVSLNAPAQDVPHVFQPGNREEQAYQHRNGGGWVAKSASVNADAYVGPEAEVSGQAVVGAGCVIAGFARILDQANIIGNASVEGEATVSGNAIVTGNASLRGSAWVADDAKVCGDANVENEAHVHDHAHVGDDARVGDNAIVKGNASVIGGALVRGNATVGDKARVTDEAVVCDHAVVDEEAVLDGTGEVRGHARLCGRRHMGGGVLEGNDVADSPSLRLPYNGFLSERPDPQPLTF